MNFRSLPSAAFLLASICLVAGCSLTDPTIREGFWHPRGVNEGNLAVMVANPHDLVEGRSTDYSDGTLAAAAVDRLYRNQVKSLPDTKLGVGASASGSSGSAGGGDPSP
jgi:type IV pilus biogenesis protein CpaD/CtpE